MRKRNLALGLLSLMPIAALTGCSISDLIAAFTSAPDVTGNWQIQSGDATSTSAPTAGVLLLGSLSGSGSNVTGTFRLANLSIPNNCGIPLQQVVTLSGSTNSSRTLSLTSASFNGSVLKINMTIPPVISTAGSGTIEIAGGPCAFASSPGVAISIPAINGTYTGNVAGNSSPTLPPIPTGAVTFAVTQATAPNPDGQFAVTGSLKFVGGTCTSTTAFTGTIGGTELNLASPVVPPLNLSLDQFIAFEDPRGTQMAGTSLIFGTGPCNAGLTSLSSYTGTLTKQ